VEVGLAVAQLVEAVRYEPEGQDSIPNDVFGNFH
jgi:hypothetical protein